tara:strand:- start:149 stop:613 length:465 start_codon:yes stop_codon:yes gene_type:complete
MIKKIVLAALFVLFLNGCNYQPIYSSKNVKFSIGEFQSSGNNRINKLLIKKLEIYKNDSLDTAKYNLNIDSKVNKNIAAKDKRGNPTTFTLKIAFKIEIENSLGEKKVTVFEEYTSYENNDNKFELKKYENSIKKNMIESINENIILYLQNLNY